MIPRLLLLSVLVLSSCQRDETAAPKPPVSERPSRPPSQPAAQKQVPSALLETPRIWLSGHGGAVMVRSSDPLAEADAILADLEGLPPSAARDFAMSAFIGRVADRDPTRALELLAAWTDGRIERWSDTAQSLMRKLAPIEPEAAADFIRNRTPQPVRAEIWSALLAELPPDARLAYLPEVPEGNTRLSILADLLHVWPAEDPSACAAWLDGLLPGLSEGEIRLLGQPRRLGPDTIGSAEPWIAAYQQANTAAARRYFAEQAWEDTAPEERGALYPLLRDTLPELAERARDESILRDPAGFAGELDEFHVAELPAEVAENLVRRWSERHPRQALEWAARHDRPEAAAALSKLYLTSPDEAFAAARELPRGPDLDQALSTLCSLASHHGQTDEARALLPLFDDPAKRVLAEKDLARK